MAKISINFVLEDEDNEGFETFVKIKRAPREEEPKIKDERRLTRHAVIAAKHEKW